VNAQVFGGKCGESWASYDPDTSSWRTYQTSLFGDSTAFSDRFPKSGMMRNGVLYPRTMSERPTSANAFGLWPTPLAQEAKHGTVTEWELTTDRIGTKESLRVKVAKAEQQWPTPTSMTGGEGVAPSHVDGTHGWNIGAAVQDSMSENPQKNWPTPSARDWKDTPGMAQSATNADGSHRDRTDQLPRKVYANEPTGTTQGGSLNPTWVEWLMGYPDEWTVLED